MWVTFDCYGTLIDWENGIRNALDPYLPAHVDRSRIGPDYIRLEAEVEREAYRSYEDVLRETSRRLLVYYGSPFPEGDDSALPNSLRNWSPFPEVPVALKALRASGCRLAILSNVDRHLIPHSIEKLGAPIDVIVTAEDVRAYKPKELHWTTFLDRTGALVSETVHVAASLYHDVATAKRLGFRTVFVNRNGESSGPIKPSREIPDLSPLPAVIEELMHET